MNGYPQQDIIVNKVKEGSYMERLIEQLDIQFKRYEELVNRVGVIGGKLESIPHPTAGDPESRKDNVSGYLGALTSRVDSFRHGNDIFEKHVQHLEKCI